MKAYIVLIFATLVTLMACKPEIDEFEPYSGSADFSVYLAVGNSVTSGFSDGDLYKSGQEYSYPNILAQQFKTTGGGDFKTPYTVDEFGFGTKRVLGYLTDCLGSTSLNPVMATGAFNPANLTNIYSQGPFNNMGVPGLKSFHIAIPGYGTLNPYFKRFASSPATTSVLKDAMKLNHTFFSFFLGSNDVLTYAGSGGEEGTDSITPALVFQLSVASTIDSLTKNGAKGVIASIPDISDLPFFTTVPAFGLLLDDTKAAALNQAYQAYNTAAQAVGVPQIQFHNGYNGFIIQETDAPYNAIGSLRQIKPNELILLTIPQDSIKCRGWGSQKPIPAKYILDQQEIAAVKAALESFNSTLSNIALQKSLAFCDLNKFYKNFVSGISFDGISFSTKFVTGGLFSLDGIHPNPRGQAIIANYFIEAVNAKYGSGVPKVPVSMYPGIKFP